MPIVRTDSPDTPIITLTGTEVPVELFWPTCIMTAAMLIGIGLITLALVTGHSTTAAIMTMMLAGGLLAFLGSLQTQLPH